MGSTVFISHNYADKEQAREIGIILASESIDVWFDEWKMSPGDSITKSISEALTECSHFVLLWSIHASNSNWVTAEVSAALNRAIESGNPRIIPIPIDSTPVPELIRDLVRLPYSFGDDFRNGLIKSITGESPSSNLVKSIVGKYQEIIYEGNDPDYVFGISYCPNCGEKDFSGSSATLHDDTYYTLKCNVCGWSDWTQ